MTATFPLLRSRLIRCSVRLSRGLAAASAASLLAALVACGGSADAPPPPEGAPSAEPPVITQQPASVTVTAGQPASFTVAASGSAPLAYQWQRNGVAVDGANGTTYTVAATTLGDSGATFRAVVSNVAGSATSNTATLTVTAAAPVLTVAPQPASLTVAAGAQAAFTVGGTCSSGTLAIQWQRSDGGGAFADIAGATAASYAFTASAGDSGSRFRAALNCSGQSATTSDAATLTVTVPSGVTLSLYTLNGLRDQARVTGTTVIDRLADGSYAFFAGSQLKRLSADRLTITTIAGDVQAGYADGPAASARFANPIGLTHDSAGVIYVSDTQNEVIRRVATDGTVSTLAGSAGQPGNANGTGAAARFAGPSGIALGPDGDLYVADGNNSVVRRVSTAGVASTYAGTGASGFLDGPAASARFGLLRGLALASNGDVVVSDAGNAKVRRILRSGSAAGDVETLAGGSGLADGTGTAAGIPSPGGLVLQGGAVFVRDSIGLIRRIDLGTLAVTTFAGSRTLGSGYADGTVGTGRVGAGAAGLTTGTAGGLVIADVSALRNIDAAGTVTTFAAGNTHETDAGTGVLAQLPLDAEVLAANGNGLAANYDAASRTVRRIDATGNVTLAAGLTGPGANSVVDGTGSAAQFGRPGISIASAANGVLYVGDTYVLRRIGTDNVVTTLAGSTTEFGSVDGTGGNARFNAVAAIAIGPNGDAFVADPGSRAIRRVTPAGVVTTYAGVLGQGGFTDGAATTVARLQLPSSLTFTPDGTLWFADGFTGSQQLRKVSPDGSTVTTVSGFLGIRAMASDAAGVVYVMINADNAVAGGLYAYDPATGTRTRLIVAGIDQQTHLGSTAPAVPFVTSIAVLGPKRILLSGQVQVLLLTLP